MGGNQKRADEDLVLKVAEGNRRAFLELYDRYASRVYALALRMLGESMAAEDITQEVFIKLWSRAGTYRSKRGSLATWLLTIARRTALDRIRLEGRRPVTAEPGDEQTGWEHLVNGESGTEEARWRSLRFAVMDLPAEQRLVIEHAFYYGLSQSQIAAQLDIPLGTVKTRMRLGMDKLRLAWLEGEPGNPDASEEPPSDVLKGGEGV